MVNHVWYGQIVGKYVHLPTSFLSNGPGLFSLSDPDMHTQLYKSVGFQDIETCTFDCPVWIAESPEAMWEQVSTIIGPLVKTISDLDPSTRERVRKDFVETLSRMFGNGKVILTGEVIVTTGTKPLA